MTNARAICDALGFDPTNHHNAAACPYCIPDADLRAEIKRRAADGEFSHSQTPLAPLIPASAVAKAHDLLSEWDRVNNEAVAAITAFSADEAEFTYTGEVYASRTPLVLDAPPGSALRLAIRTALHERIEARRDELRRDLRAIGVDPQGLIWNTVLAPEEVAPEEAR